MIRIQLLLALFALSLVGCDSGPDVQPVSGVVTLDGTPIAGAVVTFSPVQAGSGSAAVGHTDPTGKYQLTDMNSTAMGSGAAVGDYHVAILWYKPSDPSNANATGDTSTTEDEVLTDDKAARTTVAGPDALLPQAYQSADTSGLTASVKSGENTFDFALDSNYKGPEGK